MVYWFLTRVVVRSICLSVSFIWSCICWFWLKMTASITYTVAIFVGLLALRLFTDYYPHLPPYDAEDSVHMWYYVKIVPLGILLVSMLFSWFCMSDRDKKWRNEPHLLRWICKWIKQFVVDVFRDPNEQECLNNECRLKKTAKKQERRERKLARQADAEKALKVEQNKYNKFDIMEV